MKLYTYYRSSAAYRVRIAMNLKGIEYDSQAVSLLDKVHKSAPYLQANPQGLVPALELDDGSVVGQSTAILEYLEETHCNTPLLPADPAHRAQVRSLANTIACDIHPLNNLRIQHYLRDELGADKSQVDQWYARWIHTGFGSIEKELGQGNGSFCFDDAPGMADCYLIPQVYNAIRFNVDIDQYAAILSVYNHCNTLEAFQRAHPDQQADCPSS
ncbi:MAG: maleylacetoacetate isomerase [Proteobacteria bacterium]|nr:maleylacetoacetate isomerase [Pseudomonadota bacterium]